MLRPSEIFRLSIVSIRKTFGIYGLQLQLIKTAFQERDHKGVTRKRVQSK